MYLKSMLSEREQPQRMMHVVEELKGGMKTRTSRRRLPCPQSYNLVDLDHHTVNARKHSFSFILLLRMSWRQLVVRHKQPRYRADLMS